MWWYINLDVPKRAHLFIFLTGHCHSNQKMTLGSSRLRMCDWKVSLVISSCCRGLRKARIWFSVSLSGAIVHSRLQLPLFQRLHDSFIPTEKGIAYQVTFQTSLLMNNERNMLCTVYTLRHCLDQVTNHSPLG